MKNKYKILTESSDLTKSEIKKMIKDIFEDEFKKHENDNKIKTEDDVKKIVRDMLRRQYRIFWEKAPLYINQI
jgi:hypothetical protein